MDIAIIGIAGRFPDAENVNEFYKNLVEGKDSVRSISFDRLDETQIDKYKNYYEGGYLQNIDKFDHDFFGISLGEAENMDPTQRILLEVVHTCIDNAGYDTDAFWGAKASVYVGDSELQYYKLAEEAHGSLYTGNMKSLTASRVSRFFNLRGSALSIDTTCSSSLVALHVAINELRSGESDYAFVCGASINVFAPEKNNDYSLNVLSNTGKVKAFSADADGTAVGEAVVCVLLKPLSKALEDKDVIQAIIKGSALNQDAGLSASITAPSSIAQAEVIEMAWIRSQIDPRTVTFIETHGTGTKLGDPIEIQGLSQAFGKYTSDKSFCAISSVKSNIGHTDSAAGIVSLIKTVLALKYKKLFPTLNFSAPNPFIDFKNSAVYVNDTLKDWQASADSPRRAGVSSFGLSGTNCHVVLEEAPTACKNEEAESKYGNSDFLIAISAKNPRSLKSNMEAIASYIRENDKVSLEQFAYTLCKGRKHHNYRFAAVVSSVEELLRELAIAEISHEKTVPKELVLLFSNHIDINEEIVLILKKESAVFKTYYETCASHFIHVEQKKYFEIIAFQYSFYHLLKHKGISSINLVGEGIGKKAVSLISGNISFEEVFNSDLKSEESSAVEMKEKAARLRAKFSGKATVFVELGFKGSISDALLNINENNPSVKFINIPARGESVFLNLIKKIYVANGAIDWTAFYKDNSVERMELPSYQFLRQACWVKKKDGNYINEWFYKYDWINHPLTETSKIQNEGPCLLFDSSGFYGLKIKESLVSKGITCLFVKGGEVFNQLDETTFSINYSNSKDYELLARVISERKISGIIHLSAVVENESIDEVLKKGLYAHYQICKSFDGLFSKEAFRYTAITVNGRKVSKEDVVHAELGCIHGFFSNMLSEYKGLCGKCIDVSEKDLRDHSDKIVDEIFSPSDKIILAYRQGERYVPNIYKQEVITEKHSSYIKQNGVYFIVGGAKGIGFEIARHLAEQETALKLIVLDEEEIEAKAFWPTISPDAENYKLIQDLLTLEKLNHEVYYYSGKVSDLSAVLNIYEEIKRRYGKIDGVIYSEKLAEHRTIVTSNEASFKDELNNRVRGPINLYEVTKAEKLDFFVLFSFNDWIYGQVGHSNAGAGNLFKDLYAQQLIDSDKDVPVKVINWPEWKGHLGSSNPRSLWIEDGLLVFDRIMNSEGCNFLISNTSPELFTNNPFYMFGKVVDRIRETNNTLKIKNDEEIVDNSWSAVENKIAYIWKEVLKVKELNLEDDFFEMGGHSINGSQVINRIGKTFDVQLDFEEIFEYATIRSLALRVAELVQAGQTTIYKEIPRVNHQSNYPLSHAQRRLWILSQMEGGSTAYNMPGAYILDGALDYTAFSRAFLDLVDRHEALRTVFITENGEPRQKVLGVQDLGFKINQIDLSSKANAEREAMQIAEVEKQKVFDLEQGPLLRAELLKLSENKHVFLFTLHHIISDGWSQNVLIKDVVQLYQSYSKGNQNPLSPLSIQYKDYASWQNELVTTGQMKVHEQYWLSKMSGVLPVLNMPTDRLRPKVRSYKGNIKNDHYNKELSASLYKVCDKTNSTLFMVLLAGIKTLLYRYSGDRDLIVGTPIAGRYHAELEDQIGFYANTLALRTEIDKNESFSSLVSKIKETTINAYNHQAYPFDLLVEKLSLPRDVARNPIFDVLVVLQNGTNEDSERKRDVNLKVEDIENGEWLTSKFDLTFTFIESEDQTIAIWIEYNTDIYDKWRIDQLLVHLNQLYKQLATDDQQSIDSVDFVNAEERKVILAFNDTEALYPSKHTLIDLFEKQVNEKPDDVAVVYGDLKLTYAELNNKANQLAHYLRNKYSIKPDDVIGIMLDRSEQMIIGLLGILKSGGAYMPVDPDMPADRVEYMLANSNAKLLLTDFKLPVDHFITSEVFPFVENGEWLKSNSLYNPVSISESLNLAYVIYTSGSTGKPKGVMLEHEGVVNRIYWMWKYYNFTSDDVIFQKTPYVFDVSVWEFFLTLCFGAKMVLCDKEVIYDPSLLIDHINQQEITTVHFVPSMFNLFLEALDKDTVYKLKSVRHIFTSGEALSREAVSKYYKHMSASLHNLYGPTEAAVDVSYYETHADDSIIPIGKPISNIQLYILDEQRNIVPIGVPGEIYIAGIGLARGYINNSELTLDRFVPNPFDGGKSRIYKTGDLGRWLVDGNIEYLGRNDHQVKIRGNRIELGEIESCLLSYSAIKEGIAVTRKDKEGLAYLIAYVASENQVDIAGLRSYMKNKLPEYMIPSFFIQLEEIPLNLNGKIDRDALPYIGYESLIDEVETIAPRNETEQQLLEIWQDVLGNTKISVSDNFFEIGGHSLKAMAVISRMNKYFNLSLKLNAILSNPTIESLALIVKENTLVDAVSMSKYMHAGNHSAKQYEDLSLKQVFFFPPTVGISLCYLDIANQLKDYITPFFLSYNGLLNDEKPSESLDEMINSFALDIIRNSTEKDLFLAGYSGGGNLLYEVAKKLEPLGYTLTLYFIESKIREDYTDINTKRFGGLSEEDINEQFIRENYDLEVIGKYLKLFGKEESMIDRYIDVMSKFNRFWIPYKITEGSVKADAIVFYCSETGLPAVKQWEERIKGNMIYIPFDLGGHHTCLNYKQNHTIISEAIQDQLKAVVTAS